MNPKRIISKILFPEVCPLCGKVLKINEDFCLCCGSNEIRLPDGCCEGCGLEKDLCSCESEYNSALSHITGVFLYEGLIQSKLLAFKFSSRKELHRFFGDALAERAATAYADADLDTVTFVPSSRESIKEKGYNPAELIAERTAKKLFLPCQELLIKSKDTEKQHTLKAKERLTNIRGSVSPKKNVSVKSKTILLCDDIKTTGATLKECSDVLYGMGAKEVYCITVAITSNLNSFDLDKEKKNN